MTANNAWYSVVEFRNDPAERERGVIELGLVLEFATKDAWVVALAVRAGLDEAQLAPLDSLTRKVVENRSDVICREIEHVLPHALKPGNALVLLNAQNPWSIFVSQPTHIPASAMSKALSKATVEQMAQMFLLYVWRTLHKRKPLANPRRAAKSSKAAKVATTRTPAPAPSSAAPWMFAPKTVAVMPLGSP